MSTTGLIHPGSLAKLPLKPIRCNYAVRHGWAEKKKLIGIQPSSVEASQPWDSCESLYHILDVSNTPFISVAYNQAGSFMAALTASGLIRLIGLTTLCVYASVDLAKMIREFDDRKNELQQSRFFSSCSIKFFDKDRKLVTVFYDTIFIHSLISCSGMQCILHLELSHVLETVKLPILQCCSDKRINDLNENHLDDAMVSYDGGKAELLISDFLEKFRSMPSVFNCKILRYGKFKLQSHEDSILDMILYSRKCYCFPLRVVWSVSLKKPFSAEFLLPAHYLNSTEGSWKGHCIPLALFHNCHLQECLCFNVSDTILSVQDSLKRLQSFNHNMVSPISQIEETFYSIWDDVERLPFQADVFCALVTPQKYLYLIHLSQDLDKSSHLAASLKLKRHTSLPFQLISNIKNGLLLCLSSECLTLFRIRVKTRMNKIKSGENHHLFTPQSDPEVSVEPAFYYQKPLADEQFLYSFFSYAPTSLDLVLLYSGKKKRTIHFLAFQSTTSTAQCIKSIDVSKCGEFMQMKWIPFTFQWSVVSPSDRSVILFGPPRSDETWHLTFPNFRLLVKNFEKEFHFDKDDEKTTEGLTSLQTYGTFQSQVDLLTNWFMAVTCRNSFLSTSYWITSPEEPLMEHQPNHTAFKQNSDIVFLQNDPDFMDFFFNVVRLLPRYESKALF